MLPARMRWAQAGAGDIDCTNISDTGDPPDASAGPQAHATPAHSALMPVNAGPRRLRESVNAAADARRGALRGKQRSIHVVRVLRMTLYSAHSAPIKNRSHKQSTMNCTLRLVSDR